MSSVNLITLTAAFLCLAAHILIATSIATNYWLRFRTVTGNTELPLNPLVNDTGIPQRTVYYRGVNLGIWVACFKLQQGSKTSCGFIDSSCRAKICWIREHESDPKLNKDTCKRQTVSALKGKCNAFQTVRAFAVAATFFSILATTFLICSLCVLARLFASFGGLFAVLSAFCGLISFSVFLGQVVNAQSLSPNVARTGFSHALCIASWVIALFSAIVAYLSAFAGTSEKEDDEFGEDVYEMAA